ncbi:Anti-sigma-K factor rskA [Chitinophaga sp. CF118]|uniref:anti-sigma factor n=1 Tax=Chitinophaga sp. CF118 TaxID=1884367 RepID=UPI0008E4DE0C|nr:anti-sigma factor [Chitinophaga sp. CF118]SFE13851.1 Anti-sigma-K factor rskA [Chitinophaga sp. CF118]
MDVQRYISSGIIESHAAGLVSESEAREVEAAIMQYPEVKAAADAVRVDMERYVQIWAVKPPAGLRKQLMERLNEKEEEVTVPVQEEAVEEEEEPRSLMPQIPVLKMWQYGAAAAILLLIISSIMNFVFVSRIDEYKNKNTKLSEEQEALSVEKNAFSERYQQAQKEMDMMKDPAFKWVKMQGVNKHTGIVATVCWNPQSKETFILAQELPATSEDKQYQLWAIVNGHPIDAGVFELGNMTKSLQKVKPVVNAQVFVVTLEKKGGSITPSLDQMFVAGKVAS